MKFELFLTDQKITSSPDSFIYNYNLYVFHKVTKKLNKLLFI